jgi:hypothetical protein
MSTTTQECSRYIGLPTSRVTAANGVDYAYRDTGPQDTSGTPLVLLQHFRGNLDNWDPALVDTFGVGASRHHLQQRRRRQHHGIDAADDRSDG